MRPICQFCKLSKSLILVQTSSDTFWPTEGEAAARAEKIRAPEDHFLSDEDDEDGLITMMKNAETVTLKNLSIKKSMMK